MTESGSALPTRREARHRTMLRRWTWLTILVVGVVLFEAVHFVVVETGNPNLVPAMLLLGACVVPASLSAFIYGRNPGVRFRPIMLVATAAVGGVIGTVAAGLLESDTLKTLGTLPVVAVAVSEELAKLLVPIAALSFLRPARTADGLLLGVASGAGFAVLETLGYSASALLHSHEDLAAVDDLLFQRAVFSPATHMAWSGLLAAALFSAARRRWTVRSLAILLGTFVVVVGLHAIWDTRTSIAGYIVLAVVSTSIFAVVVHLVTRAQPDSQHPPVRPIRPAEG